MRKTFGQAAQGQAFAARLFASSLAAAELMTIYVGLQLGLYEDLANHPGSTLTDMARRTGIDARYLQEWLEQQVAADIVGVDDPNAAPAERRHSLPDSHADALIRDDTPVSVAPFALLPVGGVGPVLPAIMNAMRTGGGVPSSAYGEDLPGGRAGINKSVFVTSLARWIQQLLPEVHAQLSRPGARAADVACGSGWSSIALARAYPGLMVNGFDLEEDSVAAARANAREQGLADRVTFEAVDAADLAPRQYSLVCLFDALHDMARPVEVLRSCRRMLEPGASLLVMEPNASDAFHPSADETERFFYAVSVLHCLPISRSQQPSAATGTVIRPDTVRRYAVAAGLTSVKQLPPVHRFHRLYQLRP